eukprot:Nk52_evm44s485 gene=Nk52_evmTU44s485
MSERRANATYGFALVVAKNRFGKYLAVEETKDRGWWLPGGFVEVGETFQQAAVRETMEEAGIPVQMVGVLRVEHTVQSSHNRLRVIFFANPTDGREPKQVPDEESLGARWVTLEELSQLRLRSNELLKWAQYIENGGQIYPPSIFTTESQPIPHD